MYGWTTGVSTYQDMGMEQLAFLDDCLLWEGDTHRLQIKMEQLQHVLSKWGLRINLQKCGLYVSPKHTGSPYVIVGNERLDAQRSLVVMGVGFKVGHSCKQMLQGTWQRAKNKFWSIKHLLLADTPISGSLRLLNRVVGAAVLWNVCAFPPETNALESVNQLMYQMVVWMLKSRKHGGETWAEFRSRTIRQARQLVYTVLSERWSTQWVRRWWT